MKKPAYRVQREYEEDEAWKWATGRPNNFCATRPVNVFRELERPSACLIESPGRNGDTGEIDKVISWALGGAFAIVGAALSGVALYFLL
jgi:hypothetical protein